MGLKYIITCDSLECRHYVEFTEEIFGMGITTDKITQIGWSVEEDKGRKLFFYPDCTKTNPYTKFLGRFRTDWMARIPSTQKNKPPILKIFSSSDYEGNDNAKEAAIIYIKSVLEARKPKSNIPVNSGIPKSIVEVHTTYYLKKLGVERTEHKYVLTMKGGKKFSRSITLYGKEKALQLLTQIYKGHNND